MDTIQIFITEFTKDSGPSLTEWFTIAKEMVTILGIIGGLIVGGTGIAKYLRQDIIKNKVNRVQVANDRVYDKTNDLIDYLRGIYDEENLNRFIRVKEIKELRKLTKELLHASYGSSSVINTLSLFLHESIGKIEPQVIKESYSKETGEKTATSIENRTASDFYNLVQSTIFEINYLSGVIVDVPKKTTTEFHHEIRKDIRPYLSKSGYSRIKGYDFGADINPNASTSLIFYSILRKSTSNYVFKKRFLTTFQSNIPVLYNLLINEIYFPAILSHSPSQKIFGERKMHLISFDTKTNLLSNDDKDDTVEFIYSNLNDFAKFQNTLNLEIILEKYSDSSLGKPIGIKQDDVNSFYILAEESIKFIVSMETAKRLFRENKKDFLKMMKMLRRTIV